MIRLPDLPPEDPVEEAAHHMAVDEAMWEWTLAHDTAAARFFRWDRPAKTVGYFEAKKQPDSGAIRRITGGGLVEHGEDLTFAMAFPKSHPIANLPAPSCYRQLHQSLASSLRSAGLDLALAEADQGKLRATEPGRCFVSPVVSDLIDPKIGTKMGGGAQRRRRGGLIHQGSLRLPDEFGKVDHPWIESWLESANKLVQPPSDHILSEIRSRAKILQKERYLSEGWNS
ncbi:MAG: hypothetical protein AAF357_03380 [Verrucomicrobiota bacterium]